VLALGSRKVVHIFVVVLVFGGGVAVMDSNTHSTQAPAGRSPALPEPPDDGLAALAADVDGLAALAAVVDGLAAQDVARLSTMARTQRLLAWRRLLDRQDGLWLQELAALDACGAAGADQDQPAPSTASWLRNRLRVSAAVARGLVRAARALFGGAFPATAAALCAGDISAAHGQVVADGTQELAEHLKLEADPVLAEAARRLDPPQLRRVVAQLCLVADPEGADRQAARQLERRGVWLSETWAGMVAVGGLLEPEAGATVVAALAPLARPAGADDSRTGSQRNADALAELARRSLEGGWLPKAGGVRPQLLVTVELETLLGRPDAVGGEAGWAGPLDREACRRLACDGTVTRVLISREPTGHGHGDPCHGDQATDAAATPDRHQVAAATRGSDRGAQAAVGLAAQLRAAAAKLPPALGGAPCQPLEVGRATRVVAPAQRAALAVRDGGCVFPGCDRPLAWCDAHHLWHWVDGGPTDLGNLAMVCRAHHRTVHEGGWQLTRGPDGRFTTSRSPRKPRTA
jgi:hypothetical protein